MRTVTLPSEEILARMLGVKDEILSVIEDRLGLRLVVRGADIYIPDDDPDLAANLTNLIGQFVDMTARGARPSGVEVRYALDLLADGHRPDLLSLLENTICVTNRGKQVRPYTQGQKEYVDAIDSNDVIFAIGPAGTGKTYLAVAKAVAALRSSSITRIVLVRPVVEAGERLGYLPGDLLEKIDPYIRPLHDAFYDLLPTERFTRYVEKGIIEIAPLAYMRGRTLNSSFIILDEAQNTTREQMKMFLTRLGLGSKAVVTGDITQVDLPANKESGLRMIGDILKEIPGIAFCNLTNYDVVRHDIVQKIVRAYEAFEKYEKYAGYSGDGRTSQALVS
ncbi:MAG: PhoH family protein [Synergistaceae bacterium]|jgi:phosphate starvation-inducible PhoH-like protein|nr:PhoH family protein [Synergistaceae bacterium]